ncbi:MAG TPA: chemotaxis protein CheX [Gemmataceae bacterium]|nr:chemotaxis protein CheX [Gemmataceae bacterium]
MTDSRSPGGGFPSAVANAVKTSVENTFSVICGEKPIHQANGHDAGNCPCVVGIISFVGGIPWSLSLVLPEETAPALAQKFTGMEIPFDTPDMGDVAAELVNVLAGEVTAQLDRSQIKAQMSLPTVARGKPLELMGERRAAVERLDFTTKQGKFWLRLISTGSGQSLARLPGT